MKQEQSILKKTSERKINICNWIDLENIMLSENNQNKQPH